MHKFLIIASHANYSHTEIHYTPTGMAKKNRLIAQNSHTLLLGGIEFYNHFQFDLLISLLGIYPQENDSCTQNYLYKNVTRAVFIVAKNWKQPTCPSTGEGTNQCVFI